ncbi:MAG: hypothetical protein PHX13_12535, partial [Thiovulaceae bacterium]|nr:hypothetical protein [Sulfurimonadaceae bacterium]
MNKPVFLFLSFMLSGSIIFAQQKNIDTLVNKAEKARFAYDFKNAISLYKEASEISSDSIFKQNILTLIAKCENGISMLEYGIKPTVIGNIDLSFRDFFLYYDDLSDSSWCQVPQNISNAPVSLSPRCVTYLRGGEKEIIFSGKNKNGRW